MKRSGVSAVLRVLRRAEHLRRARTKRIAEAYKKAYRGKAGLGEEFAVWGTEAAWPER